MTYKEAKRYLSSFMNYENKNKYPYKKSFKLERMRFFLKLLDNPQDSLQCLHIAGTKGKGSVCVFLAYILKEAGFRVGLYTSPHLVDFRERIRILKSHKVTRSQSYQSEFEGMISKKEITHLMERLKAVVEKYQRVSTYGNLTFFEVYTALAFMYFKEQRVDYAVLETGLGGRLDATNTVNPLICGITPISYDHMDILGKSLSKIAKEKAGIIKSPQPTAHSPQLIAVSAPQKQTARGVIRQRCRDKNAKLYEIGKDIIWHKKEFKNAFQLFNVKGKRGIYANLRIRLTGEHQLDNAAVAIGMAEALNNKNITFQAIRTGLKNAVWPGRLEVVGSKPIIVLDGAQNTASAIALKEAIKKYFSYNKLILVLGISQDKDIKRTGEILCSIADKIVLTKAKNPRAADPRVIKKAIDKPVMMAYTIKESIREAKHLATPGDLILISGSLFVVGEARKVLLNLTCAQNNRTISAKNLF